MKIGIDISQTAYEKTGVGNYLFNFVDAMLQQESEHEYVLFYSNLRKPLQSAKFKVQSYKSKVKIKTFRYPPVLLDLLWNRLHILPIENLIGDVDIFISSDWTEPPTRSAKKATILYDLIVYKYPEESNSKIVSTQKRKLAWSKKEVSMFLCISNSTLKDAKEILKIDEKKLTVIYPGVTV